eukprot:363181-Chlamydomonas_euryale.AAC.1
MPQKVLTLASAGTTGSGSGCICFAAFLAASAAFAAAGCVCLAAFFAASATRGAAVSSLQSFFAASAASMVAGVVSCPAVLFATLPANPEAGFVPSLLCCFASIALAPAKTAGTAKG